MAGTRYGEPRSPQLRVTMTDSQGRVLASTQSPDDKVVAVPAATTAVTVTKWQPLLIAMARGVAEAFVLAAVAVFTMLAALPDADARAILIVAGATFFTKLAAAFGFGTVDQNTATHEG